MPSELTDASAVQQVNHLLHLANDLCMAYKAAIRRLDDASMREEFSALDHSHDRYRAELGEWVHAHGGQETGTGDWHGVVERMRVVLGDIAGDDGILRAMATNEEEMASAYRVATGSTLAILAAARVTEAMMAQLKNSPR